MEAKLREYRALRRRRELIDNTKGTLERTREKLGRYLFKQLNTDDMNERNEEQVLLMDEEPQPKVKLPLIQPEDPCEVDSDITEAESIVESNQESWKYFIVKWSLYTIIWTSLFIYFIMIQFGAVFFAISVLAGIYLNTRTRPKKNGEVSAYSVFNRDCQSIDGTLNAEQLQKQMLYGMAGLK